MLTHPTLEKMKALRLYGMAKAFEEQLQMTDRNEFSFEDRLGLLIDREASEKENRRFSHWHKTIGDATLADAILDRLVHHAYKVELQGESMRKRTRKLDNESFDGKESTSTSKSNKRQKISKQHEPRGVTE